MFHSTRGEKLVSSPMAILNGLADDGGLYVIDKIPTLDYHDLLEDDYQTIAAKVLNKFFPEFSYDEIKKELDIAYSTFDIKEVVGMKKADRAYFLELFHGPTLAFKDQALVVLPRLMKLSKEKLGYEKNITILTATSGDTGGAALNGFKDVDGVSIVVLYPNGGVSPVQEAQMCSFRGENAKVLALEGNFDDCQTFVKEFFKNHKDLSLSSANSINIARLAPQVVYYFYSYVYLLRNGVIKDNEAINFDVPTGNFGNIFAGYYAKAMGLPIKNLICASNKNCVLTDFFMNGKYNKNRPFFKTNSPSMDILISSNLERLIYRIAGNDAEKNASLMKELNTTGKYDITAEMKENLKDFYGNYTSETETQAEIKALYESTGYVIDTHTAVAAGVYKKYKAFSGDTETKTVIASTASPFKFTRSVMNAIDDKYDSWEDFELVDELSKIGNVAIPNAIDEIRNAPVLHNTVCEVNEMEKVVKEFLSI